MAQTEDTELRDLVIEALEKNGSLAKIRALLRANVFLVFEDEGQNLKQNVSLDNILKLPEGALCLSIIHEFLEFCNLKNTLFVYMAESRQGTEYNYEGKIKLAGKLNLLNKDSNKEPILVTLLKQIVQPTLKKHFEQGDSCNFKSEAKASDCNFKDDQNCTYIVHEDSNSSTTSNSQSDNSSDEKNKHHLRLQLDNSDTDTSSDSARDKSSSEYIPSEHIITDANNFNENKITSPVKHEKQPNIFEDVVNTRRNYLQEQKLVNINSSSESTSYVDLKPYIPLDEKLLNTQGIPMVPVKEKTTDQDIDNKSSILRSSKEDSGKSDIDTPEYSNDFVSSPDNKNNNLIDNSQISPISPQNSNGNKEAKHNSLESPHQTSISSQSSVSISDVADLISDKSSSMVQHNNDNSLGYKSPEKSKIISNNDKSKSDDSSQFSGSPIPSLSNLSLDIHSD